MKLSLGPDVIARLLPHRRPFVMVDRVETYERPRLRASKLISSNEPVFDGHFPNLHLWPGALTIEGLAQTANLLTVIMALEDASAMRGAAAEPTVRALEGLERRFTLQATATPATDALERELETDPLSRMGFTTRIDVKLTRPVFAGHRLVYEVELTHVASGMGRFDVAATVDGVVVAEGSMTGAATWNAEHER